MSVTDDGVGLGVASGGSGSGLGMATMRERAQGVGGEVRIEALPECGTRLAVTVPRKEHAHA
jgi:two-component system NarL family sensor kinase